MSRCYHCKTPVELDTLRCPNCGIKLRSSRSEIYKIISGLIFLELFSCGVVGCSCDFVNLPTEDSEELHLRVLFPGFTILLTFVVIAWFAFGEYRLRRGQSNSDHRSTQEVEE